MVVVYTCDYGYFYTQCCFRSCYQQQHQLVAWVPMVGGCSSCVDVSVIYLYIDEEVDIVDAVDTHSSQMDSTPAVDCAWDNTISPCIMFIIYLLIERVLGNIGEGRICFTIIAIFTD